MDVAVENTIEVELTAMELELVRTGLSMLLHAEDDPEQIADLKELIGRLSRADQPATTMRVEHRRHRDVAAG